MIKYNLERIIITCLEVREGEPIFMKRKFKNEEVAKAFLEKLLNSDRKVANVQMKINYQINKENLYE